MKNKKDFIPAKYRQPDKYELIFNNWNAVYTHPQTGDTYYIELCSSMQHPDRATRVEILRQMPTFRSNMTPTTNGLTTIKAAVEHLEKIFTPPACERCQEDSYLYDKTVLLPISHRPFCASLRLEVTGDQPNLDVFYGLMDTEEDEDYSLCDGYIETNFCYSCGHSLLSDTSDNTLNGELCCCNENKVLLENSRDASDGTSMFIRLSYKADAKEAGIVFEFGTTNPDDVESVLIPVEHCINCGREVSRAK